MRVLNKWFDFVDWTFDLEPVWVGLTVYMSALLTLLLAVSLVIVVVVATIPLWVILSGLAAGLLAGWVKALFFQKEKEK